MLLFHFDVMHAQEVR